MLPRWRTPAMIDRTLYWSSSFRPITLIACYTHTLRSTTLTRCNQSTCLWKLNNPRSIKDWAQSKQNSVVDKLSRHYCTWNCSALASSLELVYVCEASCVLASVCCIKEITWYNHMYAIYRRHFRWPDNHLVASWCCGRASDLRSRGHGFESRPGTMA